MGNNKFSAQSIPLKDLLLWDENARFPDTYYNTQQQELINFFLSKPEFKIQNLIDEIIKDFDLPQLEKLVIWKNNGQLIVLEGNRRITGYKLLHNPTLTSDTALINYLTMHRNNIDLSDEFMFECLVSEDKEDCHRFIDRKHLNGNNEVNWQDAERTHYRVRRGSKNQTELIKMGITKIVRELDLPESIKNQILGKGYVTTFFRILTNSETKKKFGFEIDINGDLIVKDSDFQAQLKIIIYNILQGKTFDDKPIDSRSLNKKDEIKQYLDTIDTKDSTKVDKQIEKGTTEDIFGEQNIKISTGKKEKPLKKTTHRSHLIPNSCRLNIDESKIHNIYIELKDDLALDDSKHAVPNAVGVLFRVFLETSIDFFLEKEGITPTYDSKLPWKINKCIEIMETKGIATTKQLAYIRKVPSNSNNILGIQNFHDYVHSCKEQPSSSDLKLKWDNLQEFFQILWDYLYKKIHSKK